MSIYVSFLFLSFIFLFSVDGHWSNWTPEPCSVDCGTGQIISRRECDNPSPADGGADCIGEAEKTEECIQKPCPSEAYYLL